MRLTLTDPRVKYKLIWSEKIELLKNNGLVHQPAVFAQMINEDA